MLKKIRIMLAILVVLSVFTSCSSRTVDVAVLPQDGDIVAANTGKTAEHIRVAAVGDVMFHIGQLDSAYTNGKYDFKYMFEDIKPEIEAADIAVANFESTINPKKKPSGYPRFNAPVEVLDALKYAGFDVLTTANNHSADTGREGISNIVKMIKEKGLISSGTGNPGDDKFAVIEKNGIKVGILSYTFSTNGLPAPEGMVNMIDKKLIKNDIDKIKKQCDFTIVYMHVGNEYVREPEESTVKLFHEIADMGADCIIGNHPHVPRKTEVYDSQGKKVFIIYACGNFISAQRDPYTDVGVIVNMDIKKEENSTAVEKVEIVPVYVLKYKVGSKIIYRVVKCTDIDKYKEATQEQIEYARKTGQEIQNEDEPALEVFNTNN